MRPRSEDPATPPDAQSIARHAREQLDLLLSGQASEGAPLDSASPTAPASSAVENTDTTDTAFLSPPPPDDSDASGRDVFSLVELGQRCAELEIRLDVAESERWHARSVLAALPQPVIVTDPFEDVVLMSSAAATLFGVEPGFRGFGPFASLGADPRLLSIVEDVRSLHRRGARRQARRELVLPHRNALFDLTLICVCDHEDGRPSPWGVVTFLSEVQAQVPTSDADLMTVQAEITSALAHELRTPLASIRAYAELLRDGEARDAATQTEFLRIISSEAERLSRLVDNMHLLAQIESGQTRSRIEPFDPAESLLAAVRAIAPQARTRGLHLDLPDLPPPNARALIHGDRDLLQHALLNALSNAIRYSPTGGSVRTALSVPFPSPAAGATTDTTATFVELTVSDSGAGIPPKELPFVFDKFYRGPSHTGLTAGSGLGLPLVRSVVETVHGGSVRLEPGHAGGTDLIMRLPARRNAA